MKTEAEDMPRSWTQESRVGLGPPLQRPDPQPWPDHLQRPDFFHRSASDHHRPSALNHHMLAMEQRPTDIFGQQRPPTINERQPIMEHRPYNDQRPSIPVGHQRGSIINLHRPLEAPQMPNPIDSEGEAGRVDDLQLLIISRSHNAQIKIDTLVYLLC